MADALDFLRKAALHKRIHGVAGGNRILWQDKDLRALHDYVMSARHEELICDDLALKSSTAVIPDRASLAKIDIELRDFNPDDLGRLCLITNETVDHTNDSVKLAALTIASLRKIRPCWTVTTRRSRPLHLQGAPSCQATISLQLRDSPSPEFLRIAIRFGRRRARGSCAAYQSDLFP
jgi:hypothetical protein